METSSIPESTTAAPIPPPAQPAIDHAITVQASEPERSGNHSRRNRKRSHLTIPKLPQARFPNTQAVEIDPSIDPDDVVIKISVEIRGRDFVVYRREAINNVSMMTRPEFKITAFDRVRDIFRDVVKSGQMAVGRFIDGIDKMSSPAHNHEPKDPRPSHRLQLAPADDTVPVTMPAAFRQD